MIRRRANLIAMNVGFVCFILGIGGIGGACEGQGNFLISAIIFAIGMGLCLATMREGTKWEK